MSRRGTGERVARVRRAAATASAAWAARLRSSRLIPSPRNLCEAVGVCGRFSRELASLDSGFVRRRRDVTRDTSEGSGGDGGLGRVGIGRAAPFSGTRRAENSHSRRPFPRRLENSVSSSSSSLGCPSRFIAPFAGARAPLWFSEWSAGALMPLLLVLDLINRQTTKPAHVAKRDTQRQSASVARNRLNRQF